MRRYLIIFFAIALIFLCSCQKKTEICQPILQEGGRYKITLIADGVETTGELFFSEGGVLHFLHTDQTSPRFGLEEILKEDTVIAMFDTMQHEIVRWDRGTGLLYPLAYALRSVAPKKSEGDWRFENDTVRVLWDGKMAEGVVCNRKICVKFLSEA